jgi:hypothetical protein
MVKASVIFPDYFGKDATKNLLEMIMKQGENQRVLIALYNHGILPMNVKNVTGALVEESATNEGEYKYIQNFTIDNLGAQKVMP